ncbi:DUF2630 family protein [Streptomyces sp. NPDC059271]|uniref:DUF2630 family protein n=1 Tax=Streptomyces sp. NPDC059271 TaxID=3346799 RepID=UPI0036AEEBCA
MDQKDILARIEEMVAAEHQLRDSIRPGALDTSKDRARLRELERELDQCWDLLRQRRARSEFGENPDEAQARPVSQVEGYLG